MPIPYLHVLEKSTQITYFWPVKDMFRLQNAMQLAGCENMFKSVYNWNSEEVASIPS